MTSSIAAAATDRARAQIRFVEWHLHTPPCGTTSCMGAACCGTQCCAAGQLCCFIEVGPGTLRCSDPVLGRVPRAALRLPMHRAHDTGFNSRGRARSRTCAQVTRLQRRSRRVRRRSDQARSPHGGRPDAPGGRGEARHGVILNITPDHPTSDAARSAISRPATASTACVSTPFASSPTGRRSARHTARLGFGELRRGRRPDWLGLATPVTGHVVRASAGGRRGCLPPPPRSSAFQDSYAHTSRAGVAKQLARAHLNSLSPRLVLLSERSVDEAGLQDIASEVAEECTIPIVLRGAVPITHEVKAEPPRDT